MREKNEMKELVLIMFLEQKHGKKKLMFLEKEDQWERMWTNANQIWKQGTSKYYEIINEKYLEVILEKNMKNL